MKRSKLLLTLTMMLALCACLFSVPVLSGENPWDADGGNGGGTGNPLDSVEVVDAAAVSSTPIISAPTEPEKDEPNLFEQATVKVSNFVLNLFYRWSSNPAQKNRFAF